MLKSYCHLSVVIQECWKQKHHQSHHDDINNNNDTNNNNNINNNNNTNNTNNILNQNLYKTLLCSTSYHNYNNDLPDITSIITTNIDINNTISFLSLSMPLDFFSPKTKKKKRLLFFSHYVLSFTIHSFITNIHT